MISAQMGRSTFLLEVTAWIDRSRVAVVAVLVVVVIVVVVIIVVV